MATFEDLKELLEDTVFPDIEEAIDDIFEVIADEKNASDEQKEELSDLRELKTEFTKVLEDINNEELSQEECDEIYDDIVEMIEYNDEDY